ncbi:MAG: hypothetical protein IKL86_00795 [Clostridia bacterium]|nr:hypothetical protein [Clostridia bacterium]
MKKLTKLQLGLLLGAVAIICLGLVFLVSAMQILPLFSAISNALGRYLIVIGTMSCGIMLFSNVALTIEDEKLRNGLTLGITIFAFILTLPLVYVFIAIFPANVGIMGFVGREIMMLDTIVAGFHAWFGSGAFVYVVYAFMLIVSIVFLLEPLAVGILALKGKTLVLFKKGGPVFSIDELPVLKKIREKDNQNG